MTYTLLRGQFVIRYPDQPRQGPQPDGDTIKFLPDRPQLVEALPRVSGRPPGINSRGISVRLEAIDTLETHFENDHQELLGGRAARDLLLDQLGFRDVAYFDDLPNNVASASDDARRGHVLSNGIDANGRMIGFVYPDDPALPDGATIFVDDDLVDTSINTELLRAGLAYPAFYATLPTSLRRHLTDLARDARAANAATGLWPRATADPNGPATIADLDDLERLVIWPKLFRRIVPYLAAGFTTFDQFDTWLRADPTNRDDELFLLDRLERGNLHDVITATGHQIRLTVWPEDLIITPDPPQPVTQPMHPSIAMGDVVIVAAVPNPPGVDIGAESVSVLNLSDSTIDLAGWHITATSGARHALSGPLAAGDTRRETLSATVSLGNSGDTVILTDPDDVTIDLVTYRGAQVIVGRTICFGR